MSDCTHCGLPVPGELPAAEGPVFCCPGCRAVYALLRDNGLGAFYHLRDRLGGGRPAGPVDAERLDESDAAYAHYDDPAFLARFAPDGRKAELYAEGVHCAACVWVMDQLPKVLPGVEEARLEYGSGRLRLRWDPERTSLSKIGAFLHRIGYPTHPMGGAAEAARRRTERAELVRLAVAFACAGNSMLIAVALYAGAFDEMELAFTRFFEGASLFLALPAIFYGALPFYRGAWAGLKMRVPHIDMPISLGLIGGFAASAWSTLQGHGPIYYDSLTLLVFLLLGGRWLQRRGQRAAMDGTELLAVLTPSMAWREVRGRFEATAVERLRIGDRVRVRAGECFPVDGRVAVGATHVDLGLLTGESRPVAVGPGNPVFAGTTNLADAVEVAVEASGAETRLGRMIGLVEQADAARAPIVRAADRISGWFVAAVVGLALVGGVAWWFIDPSRVFSVVVGLLVVSCPCALGLATPVALAVARGRAARIGALVRSTAAIERLARAGRVVLDKTGTLTEGRLAVADARVPAELRGAVGALEARSAHPVARAVARWAGGADAVEAIAVQEHPARGIEGEVGGRRIAVGSPAWLGLGEFAADVERAVARGDTPVMVRADGRVVGWLAMGDRVREDTPRALARFRAMGLELAVRSGDHPAVVAAVAARLGLSDHAGDVSPEGKAAEVAGQAATAMVGDGVNDAPALRGAGVGVAVAGGAEAALQVADVYLTRPGLDAVADLFQGARSTLRIVRRNLGFSLAYNAVFATLALLGLINPLVAAVIMPISSLTVIGSSVWGRTFPQPAAAGRERSTGAAVERTAAVV